MDPAAATPEGVARTRENLALVALSMAAFSLNLNTNVLGALLPFVSSDLALGGSDGKLLVAASAAGSAVGSLAIGPLTNRWGRRTTLVGGLLVFLLASLAHLIPASFAPFLVLRCVSGVAVGVAYAAASALVAEVAPYARRGRALGRFNAGMFLAIPIGMPLSVWCARSGNWPAIFAVQAAVAAAAAWLTLVAVPRRSLAEERGSTRAVLRNGPALAALFATLLHVGSFFTTVQLATTWLDQTGRVAKEDQMLLWVGLGLCSVAGSAMLGRKADRIGKRTFVLAASIVLVGCFLALAADPGPAVLLVAGGALAVVAAARTGPLQALVSGLVPSRDMAALMGLRGFAMQLGVAGFAVAAVPIGEWADFDGVLWLAAGCQAASFLAIRFGVRERGAG